MISKFRQPSHYSKPNFEFISAYPWTEYSNLLIERILSPKNIGYFHENAGAMQEMRVVLGESQDEKKENHVVFFLVVDTTDGIIADAKFQAYGESALIGSADITCEILLRKNYDQVSRLTTDMIDKKLRDFEYVSAFPAETSHHLNLILDALDDACSKCQDIAITNPAYSPPVPSDILASGDYPDWAALTKEEKLNLIKSTIRKEIQPYIELDAGGIEVLEFKDDREILIAYQGACTTCPSSTGATLSAIQQILRSRIHPELIVKPDLSLLSF